MFAAAVHVLPSGQIAVDVHVYGIVVPGRKRVSRSYAQRGMPYTSLESGEDPAPFPPGNRQDVATTSTSYNSHPCYTDSRSSVDTYAARQTDLEKVVHLFDTFIQTIIRHFHQ
jgi:hypothetical protein